MAPMTRSRKKDVTIDNSQVEGTSNTEVDEMESQSSTGTSREDNNSDETFRGTDNEDDAYDPHSTLHDVLNTSHNQVGDEGENVVKSSKKLKGMPISQNFFKDHTLTKGGSVKVNGKVIETFHNNFQREPYMNCRVETFSRIVNRFTENKRKWVSEMGFGLLLQIGDIRLPREFSYWLMTGIDPINRMYISLDGSSFPFSKNQVQWCLGIPSGKKKVPLKVQGDEMASKVEMIETLFGIRRKSSKPKVIPVSCMLLQRVEDDWIEGPEHEFKVAFLIILLHLLLCPTQSSTLSPDLHAALTTYNCCQEYDWSQLVLDKLMKSAMTFARTFYKNGFSGGAGGCTNFLVIFYLDRLHRPPIDWNYYPRIGIWTANLINEAKKVDRLKGKHKDFGALGMVKAVYGELHPMEATDRAPPPISGYCNVSSTIAHEVVRMLSTQISPKEVVVEREKPMNSKPLKKRRKGQFPNVKGEIEKIDVTHIHSMGSTEVEKFENINESLMDDDHQQQKSTSDEPKIDVSQARSKSRERRILQRNRRYPSLNDLVTPNPNVQKRLLKYVRDKGKEEDPDNSNILLQCDGQFCSARECATIIQKDGEVSNTYVNTVARLYSKYWQSHFYGRSRRMMLDHTFSNFLYSWKDDKKKNLFDAQVVRKACDQLQLCFSDKGIHNLSEVFVPILDKLTDKQNHWWCIAISLNLSQILIIDSNSDNAVVEHSACIKKIVSAMDLIFSMADSNWKKGQMTNWKRMPLLMTRQLDSHSCGILMLLAIKRCAYRFEANLEMKGTTQQMRNFLLYEDLMNEENEALTYINSYLKEKGTK